MASQITHIVYGAKIFKRRQNLNWHDFVIGTVFPDIRYIAKLDRNTTHLYNTSEDQIPTENSFKAGFYAHSLVDEKRDQLLNAYGLFKLIPFDGLHTTAVKMLEDTITFSMYDNWEEVVGILDDVLPDERNYQVNDEILSQWHKGLQEYIQSGPNQATWEKVLVDVIPELTAKAIAQKAQELSENKQVCDILSKVFPNI